MDLPVHMAGGAFVGNLILYFSTTKPTDSPTWDSIKIGIACFLCGICSHLLLDAMPYYDWIFHIPIFSTWPKKWLWRQIAVTFPVIVIIVWFNRNHWFLSLVSMAGGLYPDFEKLAYFDFNLPKAFVLFPYHSCYLSGSEWEKANKPVLIVAEIILFVLLMTAIYKTSRPWNVPVDEISEARQTR